MNKIYTKLLIFIMGLNVSQIIDATNIYNEMDINIGNNGIKSTQIKAEKKWCDFLRKAINMLKNNNIKIGSGYFNKKEDIDEKLSKELKIIILDNPNLELINSPIPIEIENNFYIPYLTKDCFIHCATKFQLEKCIKELLKIDIDINVRNSEGYASIHYSTLLSYPNIVIMLIGKGARLDIKDKLGETALHYSILLSNLEVFYLLRLNGADIRSKNTEGENIIDSAKKYCDKSFYNKLKKLIKIETLVLSALSNNNGDNDQVNNDLKKLAILILSMTINHSIEFKLV